MKIYHIWSEGYIATGERAGAYLHGQALGETFEEACKGFFKADENYHLASNTYWGCRLFSKEDDARASYG